MTKATDSDSEVSIARFGKSGIRIRLATTFTGGTFMSTKQDAANGGGDVRDGQAGRNPARHQDLCRRRQEAGRRHISDAEDYVWQKGRGPGFLKQWAEREDTAEFCVVELAWSNW